jgi:hypothetical protein
LKTGRISNNCSTGQVAAPNPAASISMTTAVNNHPSTPPSAALLTGTPPSSSSTTPVEARPLPHPASALSGNYHSLTAKSAQSPASLRLRRELTQPSLNRLELISSSENVLDKSLIGDILPFPYRSSVKATSSHAPLDIRSKIARANPNRLSADYFPTRQVSRTKVNDSLPSPKGKHERDELSFSLRLSGSWLRY